MHGVKRADYEAVSKAEREAKLKKIVHYTKLTKIVLKAHRESVRSEKMFQLVGSLIEINPDFYSLWNYRKVLVENLIKETGEAEEKKAAICAGELKLAERALRKNPKSYYAWHHRVWTITFGTTDLKTEVALCTKYLAMDSRNFHCWNYRRYCVVLGKIPLEDELEFSSRKIDDNFSNYSAWHHRSFLIPQLIDFAETKDLAKLVEDEFELLKQAFFTDPSDQSAWLYHRWLLAQVVGLGINSGEESKQTSSTEPKKCIIADKSEQIAIIKREMEMAEELVAVEPDCKWAMLTIALLIHGLRERGVVADGSKERVRDIFGELISLDPMRRQYYLDMKAKVSEKNDV